MARFPARQLTEASGWVGPENSVLLAVTVCPHVLLVPLRVAFELSLHICRPPVSDRRKLDRMPPCPSCSFWSRSFRRLTLAAALAVVAAAVVAFVPPSLAASLPPP